MKKSSLTLNIFLLIVLNDIGDTLAQILMKKGCLQIGMDTVTLQSLGSFWIRSLSSPLLWLGMLVMILNFFLWIAVLYKVDLSIAMPVGSTSYVFIPVAAMLFLHERISLLRWLGIFAIVLGIHFVSQSKKQVPAPAPLRSA